MTKGIEISFLSNTRDLVRGAGTTEDALERVSDSLDEMARDGDKATGKLERSFKDISDEARSATRDIDRTGDALEQAARKGRRIDTDVRIGTDGAGEAVREWGDEAKQNISETFSSFRGESEDLVQIAQDTFGGVISGLGPLGMAAGAAGAIGIGLLMGSLEEGSEEAEEMRQRISALATEFIETGGVGQASMDGVIERLKELATSTEEGQQNLAQLYSDSASAVTGFKRLADAYAGNEEQLDALIEKERERRDTLQEIANYDKGWDQEATKRKDDQLAAQKRIVEGLEDAKEAADGAAEAEAAWLASNGPAYEARVEQVESLQSELDDAIGSYGDFQDAETGALDPAGYIASMQARMDATANFNTNVQTLATQFGLTADEVQAILDQGVDFAPMLQSIIDSGMGEQYAAQIRAMLDGGQAIIDGQPTTATVEVSTNADAAGQELSDLIIDRTTSVEAEAQTTDAAKALDTVAEKPRTAPITATVNTTAASAQLADFIARKRTLTITAEVRDREGKLVP